MMGSEGFMSLGPAFWITVSVIVVSTYVTFMHKTSRPKKLESLNLDDLLLETTDDSAKWDSDSNNNAIKNPQENKNKKRSADKGLGQQELKNVFDVKQSPPVVGKSSSSRHDDDAASTKDDKKPFKSSYYYAHNQHRKTGGYSDGLKAEDYEMNKPKLLARSKGASDDTTTTTTTTTTTNSGNSTAFIDIGNSIPINRYLWDDEGKENGVAKIYIDTLPGKTTTAATTTWDQHNITKEDVMSKLVGTWKNGLMVQISSNDERYHLLIPRMYGEVEEAKIILKPNKLIIKLIKKRNKKENLRAWPQLSSAVPVALPTYITK
jgi:hypothetical protein